MVTDTRLTELVKRFGRNHAQAVWDAGLAAIATIDEVVREHAIDAGFEWVDGYLHAPLNDDAGERGGSSAGGSDARARPRLRRGVRRGGATRRPARYPFRRSGAHSPAQLPGGRREGVRGARRPDPRALGGRRILRRSARGEGQRPYGDAARTSSSPRTIRWSDSAGLAGATLFQTKLALYTSYVIAGRVPRGVVPDALWWDTGDPYHYLRVEPHRDFDVVIFGGEDHKTGQQDDTAACYRRLEERLSAIIPRVELTHRWSGQVIETPDGLPYIGQSADHQYAATGYAGNGLTFGTLAGIMISDAILERSNPWAELFDPGRKALTRGLWDYLKENVDYPYYMIRDRFAGARARSRFAP